MIELHLLFSLHTLPYIGVLAKLRNCLLFIVTVQYYICTVTTVYFIHYTSTIDFLPTNSNILISNF